MARYLLVERDLEGLTVHELEGESMKSVIEGFKPLPDSTVDIYRVVGDRKRVTVTTETVHKITFE